MIYMSSTKEYRDYVLEQLHAMGLSDFETVEERLGFCVFCCDLAW